MKKINELVNKVINIVKENKYIHYVLILIIGIIISIPLIKIQLRETHDGFIHLLRLIGVTDTLKIGQIPAIIIPDYCSTTGYSMTLFYPPLVTYIPLLFKIIAPTFAIALKLFGAACIILSGITMYSFVFKATKNRAIALFSAIIYMMAPYKLGNVYKRYAMGEFAALVIMPTLFKGMHSLFEGDGKKHYYIGIGASLLTLCHTITTIYAAMFCAIYIIFNIEKLKNKEVLKKILINIIFIIFITLMFFVPMIEAKMHADYTIFDNDLMRTTNWYAADNAIEISEFFVDIGKEDGTTFIIGIPILILLLASIFTFKKVDTKYKKLYIVFMLFSLISLHMSSKYFPWRILPDALCKLQYPWRMMGFFDFFSSLICGINLYILLKNIIKKDILKFVIVLLLVIISIIYTIGIVNQYKAKDNTADEQYEQYILKNPKINHMRVNRDYVPEKAIFLQDTYMHTRINNTLVLEGNAVITNNQKEKLTVDVEVKEATKDTILEFAYLYYPGYTATIKQADKTITLNTIESDNGYVAIKLPENLKDAHIRVSFEPTILTKISYTVSILSVIAFAIYIVIENRRNKC